MYLDGWVLSLVINKINHPLEVNKDTGYVQSNICASVAYILLTPLQFFDHLCKCLSIASHSKHIKTVDVPPNPKRRGSRTPFAYPNKITGTYLESSTLIFAAVKPFTARFFPYMTSKLNSNLDTSDSKKKTPAVDLSPTLQVVHWTVTQMEPSKQQ